jgi:hypothetical protein
MLVLRRDCERAGGTRGKVRHWNEAAAVTGEGRKDLKPVEDIRDMWYVDSEGLSNCFVVDLTEMVEEEEGEREKGTFVEEEKKE